MSFRSLSNRVKSWFQGGQSDLEAAIREGGAIAVENGLQAAFEIGTNAFFQRNFGDVPSSEAAEVLRLTMTQLMRMRKPELEALATEHQVDLSDEPTRQVIIDRLEPLLIE